mmetsp:Transcript_6214/g.11607  ORF Transcript_6214/g.11607 Transcript_6214/m.11607 type:complete len:115 (-) Transcript_6214:561-905(-)
MATSAQTHAANADHAEANECQDPSKSNNEPFKCPVGRGHIAEALSFAIGKYIISAEGACAGHWHSMVHDASVATIKPPKTIWRTSDRPYSLGSWACVEAPGSPGVLTVPLCAAH